MNFAFRRHLKFLLLIVAVIVIGLSVYYFTQNLDSHINTDIQGRLANTTDYISNYYKLKLEGELSVLETLAFCAAKEEDMASSEILRVNMLDVQLVSNYFSVFAIDKNGKDITADGKPLTFDSSEYLQRALNNERGISDLIIDRRTYKKAVILYTPIVDEEEIKGALCAYTTFESFNSSVHISTYDKMVNSYIIAGDGEVIVSPNMGRISIFGNNFFSYLADSSICGSDTIVDNFKRGEEGFFCFEHKDNSHYAYYKPLGLKDWYTICEVPQSYVDQEFNTIRNIAMSLFIGLAIAFLLILIFIIIAERQSKRELQKTNEELRINDMRFKMLTSLSRDVIFEWDLEKDSIIFPNGPNKRILYQPIEKGFPEKAVEEAHVHPEDGAKFIRFHRDIPDDMEKITGEFRLRERGDKFIWCRFEERLIRDEKTGKVVKVIGWIVDIDKQKKKLEMLELKTRIDSGSGLYNKLATELQVKECLKKYARDRHAMIVVDIDDFKMINDKKGHLYGDQVLSDTAKVLKLCFRETDILGRIGGDEFMILIKNIESEISVAYKAAKILRYINNVHNVTASAGIAIYPEDGESFEELYHNADLAMYQAKSQNKNRYVFYNELDDD